MQPSLRQAIARIDIMQGARSAGHGTGCLIAGDLVLTAMHVVADRQASPPALRPGTIVLTFLSHRTDAHIVEGRWDPQSDWVLLRCVTAPSGVRPVPLADTAVDGDEWETFGFPDANSRDGLAQLGTLENASGAFEGVAAYQLFSRQAAAGVGAPVRGLSGGPVIVDGALVGIFRSSLMRDGQFNVAGTLYACPIGTVLDRCADLLPIPDPCRGLPGLPRHALPATPYRFLEHFTARDAEIFFGRNREIRELYDRVTAGDGASVVLLYGQSGAGKSSFLDAGLRPRLTASYTTIYVRRERANGLLQTVIDAMLPLLSSPPPAPDFRALWLGIEAASAKPLVVVLDQVEETFTLPSAKTTEIGDFAAALTDLLGGVPRPQGRLVLGFRKEWLGEIQKALDQSDIDYSKVFLEALDAAAVTEITTGLTRTKRLRERYGLAVEDGLPATIAGDLTADRDSPVAPTLQVLLSRLWIDATAAGGGSPQFTADLYARVTRAGFLLTDFLDHQLLALAESARAAGGSVADVVESGLALDVLRFHISRLGTAEERTGQQLIDEYHRDEDVVWLVGELKRLFLLTEPAGDGAQGGSTRLAHDTLAPAVRTRCDESMLPGQRARRVLEARAGEWTDGQAGTPLDARDLMRVEQGAAGMRAWRADEQRLIAASRLVRRRDNVRRRTIKSAGLAATLVILLAAGVAWSFWQQNLNQRKWSNLIDVANAIPAVLKTQPSLALVLAIDAVDRSLGLNDGIVPAIVQERLAAALERARERSVWTLPDMAVVAMARDGRIAAGTEAGTIFIYQQSADEPTIIKASPGVQGLSFSDDGELLAVALGQAGLAVWRRSGDPVSGLPPQPGGSAVQVAFVPESHAVVVLAIGKSGTVLHLVDVDTQTIATHAVPEQRGRLVPQPLAVAIDGRRLVVATTLDQRVVLSFADDRAWLPLNKPIDPPMLGSLRAVTLARSAAGELLLAVASAQRISMTDVTCLTPDACEVNAGWVSADEPEADFGSVGFGRGARTVIAGTMRDGRMLAYDWRRQQVWSLAVVDRVGAFVMSHDGALAAVIGLATETRLSVIDMVGLGVAVPAFAPARADRFRPTSRLATALAFLPAGQLVSVGPTGSRIWTLDLPRGQHEASASVVAELEGDARSFAMAVDQSTGAIALLDGAPNEVRVFGPRGARESPLPSGPGTTAAAFSPNGLTVVTGSDEGRLVIADRPSGRLVKDWILEGTNRRANAIVRLAFNASGDRFAAASSDGHLRIFRRDGSPLADLAGEPGAAVLGLVFQPDGQLVAGTTLGDVLRLDIEGRLAGRVRVFPGGRVYGLALHPSGSPIFIAGTGGVRALDVTSNALLDWPLPQDGGALTSVAVSPDGRLLVAAIEAELKVWRVGWQEWLSEGCERLRRHPLFTSAQSGVRVDSMSGISGIEPYRAVDACQRRVWNAAAK